jgi:site-specific recombinase XerD
VSAVRRLAAAIGADPLVAQVRCTQVQQEHPSALSDLELSQLLARPDLRTTIGIRDRAILELLTRAGLRRSELTRLTLADDVTGRTRTLGDLGVLEDQCAKLRQRRRRDERSA